ncbi:uncharacterized protein LOC125943923 [Dermacentor silvarum]|uniref:uncharacterized protein LOC125943923 n=1 Tax=Dermacentor silvarum TaxID=543639 RepID=UPI0021018332|nr:uncharacterized protein LOC125943923 [Dermacentor silvarum]
MADQRIQYDRKSSKVTTFNIAAPTTTGTTRGRPRNRSRDTASPKVVVGPCRGHRSSMDQKQPQSRSRCGSRSQTRSRNSSRKNLRPHRRRRLTSTPERNIVESKPAPPPPPRRRRRRRRQRRKRLIRFLLPCLYDRRYGQDLEWIDEEGGTFRIRWSQHPGISQDPPVKLFKDWAVIKNMWNEDDPRNLDKAKNRVQSTLGRMEYVKKVESNDANYWCFRIENQQLLDDTKRRLRLKQQMKDGISHNVKYCPIHKTDYAPCCCECSSLRTPPVAVFPDQEEGDVTHFRDEFELFSTQMTPHVSCWFKMDDSGEVELTGPDVPSFL